MSNSLGAVALAKLKSGEGVSASYIKEGSEAALKMRLDKLMRKATAAAASNPEDADVVTPGTVVVSDLAAKDASLTVNYSAATTPSMWGFVDYAGGKLTVNAGNEAYFPVASSAPANGALASQLPLTPSHTAAAWEISTVTEAPLVAIQFRGFINLAGYGYRIKVNGRYVSKTPSTFVAGGLRFLHLDFQGVSKSRIITVECARSVGLVSMHVPPRYKIAKPSVGDKLIGLTTGDSYSEGEGSTFAVNSWPQVLARRVGIDDMRQVAVGGTGPFANFNNQRKNIRGQITDWFTVNSDILPEQVGVANYAGGFNDWPTNVVNRTPTEIATQAAGDWAIMRTLLPNALIVVYGIWGGTRGPDSRTRDIETAFKAAFDAWADPFSIFIPVSLEINGNSPWLYGNESQLFFTTPLSAATSGTLDRVFGSSTGTYNILFSDGSVRSATLTNGSTAVAWTGAVTATATASAYVDTLGNGRDAMNPDRLHPSDYGHILIGHRAEQGYRAGLQALQARLA